MKVSLEEYVEIPGDNSGAESPKEFMQASLEKF